jgi:hypothetical protein
MVNIEVVYSFIGIEIDQLSERLAQVLNIRFYSHSSPMIGPWYSSMDLNKLAKDVREVNKEEDLLKKIVSLNQDESQYQLVLNDPDPGYRPPDIPGAGDCLLRISAGIDELKQVEKKLHASDLPFKRIKNEEQDK